MDKISVIVPVYNASATIARCLDSLVNQTHKNMEIIVINDGSKDNSLDIINEYKKKYKKIIKVISRENKGIGFTRNEGISAATGDYLGFVDSDDYVEATMYEHLYDHLIKHGADIVVCDYYEFGSFGRRMRALNNFKDSNVMDNPFLINEINTAPWNKLYKKEIFEDLKYPENLKYEDLSTIAIALLKANKISKLNEPLVDYYINMSGETNTYNYRVFDLLEVLDIILVEFPRFKEMNDALLELCIDKIFPYIIAMYDNKDRELMLRYLKAGISFLDKNFKGWRIKHILNFNGFKDFLIRIMQTNKTIYSCFIKRRVPKTKKKILFTNYSLDIGGIEKALVNMVNNMDFSKYDVTVLLQHKKGDFLKDVDKRVEIQGFNLSNNKNVLLRKTINMFKIIFTILKNVNKYDFAACYGTGYKASSLVALYASKNNATWMHTNIINYLRNKHNIKEDEKKLFKKINEFLTEIKFRKFKNYLFVSKNAMEAYLSLYPEDKQKCHLCYNFVDYKKILEMSKEKINVKKEANKINLVNISRHTEYDKRITRIINAVDKLRDKYDLKLYLVGDGPDHQKFIDLVKEKTLEKQVVFLGSQSNPYPYYLLGDIFVLSSAFEGFPTVYTESLTLNVPIVTTDVSDAKSFIDKKYGIVCDNNDESLTKAIEEFISKNFKIKKSFDAEEFNSMSLKVVEGLIDNG